MFRLLLNVDDAVRDRALAFAAKALPDADAGLLVVENHGNAGSLRHLRARRHGGDRWFAELSHEQVDRLLARHGFEIVERRGFSMLTPGAARPTRWPGRPTRRCAGCRARDGYAVNVLYAARRVPRRARRRGALLGRSCCWLAGCTVRHAGRPATGAVARPDRGRRPAIAVNPGPFAVGPFARAGARAPTSARGSSRTS